MPRFKITPLPISGLMLLEREKNGDERGFLSRLFCADELRHAGWGNALQQMNYTKTTFKGTIRGMHYQHPPYCEKKLITCIKGEIFDVVVDVRKNSPTFLSWHVEILSADNNRSLLLPEGVAHGYQTLTDDVDLIYCHSEFYNPDSESGLNPFDRELDIPWPLDVTEVSQRDRNHPLINTDFKGLHT